MPTLLRWTAAGRRSASSAGTGPQWEAFTGVDGPRARPARLPARAAARGHLDPEVRRARWRCASAAARCAPAGCELAALEDEHGGHVRPGLDRRPARGAAHRGAGAGHAGRHRSGARTRSWPSCHPNLVPATVEKVAINAVMAGCRPEYLPVVLAAVEAVCTDEFNMHGVLATTWFVGPVVRGQRPDQPGHRHELRHQRPGPGQPGQRHHRPGPAAGDPQRRWRPARRGRPGHARQPGQVQLLLRRGRGRFALGVAGGRAGLRARRHRR